MAARAAEPGGGSRGGPSGAVVTEWLTAYADYLRRAAEQSANTIDLYQQITDCMVRGELAPTATQDMLGSFVQARGTAYSDRLAQLNMRFFSEMVRIGTATLRIRTTFTCCSHSSPKTRCWKRFWVSCWRAPR